MQISGREEGLVCQDIILYTFSSIYEITTCPHLGNGSSTKIWCHLETSNSKTATTKRTRFMVPVLPPPGSHLRMKWKGFVSIIIGKDDRRARKQNDAKNLLRFDGKCQTHIGAKIHRSVLPFSKLLVLQACLKTTTVQYNSIAKFFINERQFQQLDCE